VCYSVGHVQAVSPIEQAATEVARRIVDNVGKALEGKREVIELAVATLLARGHLLVEDVPGVGKTTLARALARSVGVTFRRLQFTSDLMPADVLGGSVFDQSKGEFTFRPGPIFTNVLLADEINRTTPKTQSALLEAMDERQVSIDGVTRDLVQPFFVVATQNPDELYGTYPLPESQLDRFLMRIAIGYPPSDVERRVLKMRRGDDPAADLEAVVDRDTLVRAQEAVDRMTVDDDVLGYVHTIVLATRESPMLDLGASTRGALALERAARAHALVLGRSYVTPDDVKALAVPVLAHRVRVKGTHGATGARDDAERVLAELVASVSVPL
jgi:MoxR-like ATPase